MNDNLRQIVFGLVLLVFGAGLEELLPKFIGVGFPVLLATVQALAVRSVLPTVIVIATIAGALEDAVSSLPPLTSVSYFILVALSVRSVGLPRLLVLLTFPFYQLWLALWASGLGAGIFGRLLLSLPIGGLTAVVVCAAVSIASSGGAVDERD